MAYFPRYESTFNNDLNQSVSIQILLKDVEEDIEQLVVEEMELNDSIEDGAIIARELTVTFASTDGSFTWETILADEYDKWMVTVILDGNYVFRGFVTPEEGEAPFYDQPYSVTVRATSGLKLLKGVPLTKQDGSSFIGKFTLIDFLSAALHQTLLDLPIRIYSTWTNADMDDRTDDIAATYWNQVKHDHRTYMDDATSYIDCYETLLILLQRHSQLFYYNDRWVVFLMSDHQYAPAGLYYTDFNPDGTVIGGAQDTEGVATVGVTEAIYPIDEAVIRSTSFPIKNAKTNYNYEQFPEFPLNAKMDRGTFISEGQQPDEEDEDDDGNTTELTSNIYRRYTIDDFDSGTYQGNPTEYANLPAITVGNPDPWYRRSILNTFGIELTRDLVIERATTAGGRFVQTKGEPVNMGDKIRFNFDWKASVDLGEGDNVPVQITPYIVSDNTGEKWVLRSKEGQVSEAKWEPSGSQMIGIYTTPNGDLKQWQSITVESPAFPFNGQLYFMFWSAAALGNNSKTYYRGFSVEYIPYIAGGFIPVTGDYWNQATNARVLDKDEDTIRISDTILRVMQGCMLNADGITATNPTWRRQGVDETRHFKELVNWVRFNLGWRRFLRIKGPFTGLMYSPINEQLNIQPIGYHKEYRFVDLSQVRDFVLIPPLRLDLCTGNIDAIFEEVRNPALTTNIGAELDTVVAGIIAGFNADFGPTITIDRYPPDPRQFKLIAGVGSTITAYAADGGAGNAPSLNVGTQYDVSGAHWAFLTISTDIEIGNTFTIEVDGGPYTYEVIDVIVPSDGTRPGDTREYKYIFSKQ